MGEIQHIFICGSKSLGQYGGYETFVDKLTEYHQNHKNLKYHIACKANGDGHMDETKLSGVTPLSDSEFLYHNAHCFKIQVPSIGAAVAIYYDIKALHYGIRYCKNNHIPHPIFFILACRIGPFISGIRRKVKKLGGKLYINPDGHEWKRGKWPPAVRKYWKVSEQAMVKNSDLVVCDSKHIERFIRQEYGKYHPSTTYIAYGSDTSPSLLKDNDREFTSWLSGKDLKPHQYYLVVGRFVPENNFETMIREFMASSSRRDFAIITTANTAFLKELENKLHFGRDSRIKFVGTVYGTELLKKIRENAYGYFHGHEVGGTNPSLLEALGSTQLSLLLDVGFNREVAEDAALYWSKEKGSLSSAIAKADQMNAEQLAEYEKKAKERIRNAYSWDLIAREYENVFLSKKGME